MIVIIINILDYYMHKQLTVLLMGLQKLTNLP